MSRIKRLKEMDGVEDTIDITERIAQRKRSEDVSNVTSGVHRKADLIIEGLDRPAELTGQSSIPPRAEPKAKVYKLNRSSGTVKKTRRARPKARPARREHDGIIADPAEREMVKSISGGEISETNLRAQQLAEKRAADNGSLGVYRIFETIKRTLPEQDSMEFISHDERMEALSLSIKNAVRELQELSNQLQTEEGKEMFGDNDPRDIRLFNAVASILIRIWGHNAQNKLDDFRVNSMIQLIRDGEPTWKKLIDILVEWERVRPQLGKGSWGRK